MKFKFCLLFVIFNAIFCLSQETNNSISLLSPFFENLQELNIKKAKKNIARIKNNEIRDLVDMYYDTKVNKKYKKKDEIHTFDSINDLNKSNKIVYMLKLLILAENEIAFNNRTSAYNIAYKGFITAEKLDILPFKREFLVQILTVFKLGVINGDKNASYYLDQLLLSCKERRIYIFKYYLFKIYLNEMGVVNKNNYKKIESANAITNALLLKLDSITKLLSPKSNLNIEYFHLKALNNILKKNDSALFYFNKELLLLKKKKHIFFNSYKYEVYKEIARKYKIQKKFSSAINNLKKTKLFESETTPLKNKFIYQLYISEMYYGNNQKDSAYLALKNSLQNSFILNFKDQNSLISSLEVKNKTAEKDKLILESEARRKQNLLLLIIVSLLLILGTVIYMLSYKNTKRKQKLAEQQRELETQKNLTLLKEQEITTINAMVDGQEKERKQIAEDLHDNLGSVLATLKLHFENLKINREKKKINQEELFNKTEHLIDEAYLKVRSIAHAKNAGVIAKQGLLLAVQMMAEKISSANKIKIEVVHFNLNKRLANNLEVTVFRIIQELITNILKHADAKNATINISLYDRNLNIIIEDDGKGFDLKTINLKNGMGISSIKTRVAHLQGNFTIDTTLGKGSSIIIDIPIS